ncbi:DUF305 domain-containing protein [Flaviflexus massiliensis]|uniref:DUF305 domain-containing protein n=1 Tax=Flaviflexus massiliensis TaxID=1522309 RepID=UPI0006D57E00
MQPPAGVWAGGVLVAGLDFAFHDPFVIGHFHHQGGIAMTHDQIDNGGYQPLVDLAQQIIDIQTAEMHEIEQLLDAKGESLLTE